jgi:hypothetical protein
MRGRDPRIHFLPGRLSVSGLKRGERDSVHGSRAAGVCFDLDGFVFFLVSWSLDEKNPFSCVGKDARLVSRSHMLIVKMLRGRGGINTQGCSFLFFFLLKCVRSLLLLCFFDLLASEFYSCTRYQTTVTDI